MRVQQPPPKTYRRMGKIALTSIIALFFIPIIVTSIILNIAQRYENLHASGLLAVSSAYGENPTHMPFQEIYDIRYVIIGAVFLTCWTLIPLITTLATRPRKETNPHG